MPDPLMHVKMKEKQEEMSFLEHLEQLRWHLIRSLSAITILSIVAFLNKKIIFDTILFAPKNPDFISNRLLCKFGHWLSSTGAGSWMNKWLGMDFNALCINTTPLHMVNTKMSGQISTHIWISLIAGLVLASPYIFWEFWRFVSPALYSNERKHSRGAVLAVTSLFITGILFGYYIIAPMTVYFLGSYSVSDQVQNLIDISSYFSSVSSVTFATGLVFEFPIIAYFLSKIGILTPSFMRKYRKHAIIVILTIGAIITPPDVFSQILVSIPLWLLYEISIFISARVEKTKKKKL
jgi:sec-independent protein translocase protein TatC